MKRPWTLTFDSAGNCFSRAEPKSRGGRSVCAEKIRGMLLVLNKTALYVCGHMRSWSFLGSVLKASRFSHSKNFHLYSESVPQPAHTWDAPACVRERRCMNGSFTDGHRGVAMKSRCGEFGGAGEAHSSVEQWLAPGQQQAGIGMELVWPQSYRSHKKEQSAGTWFLKEFSCKP